MLRPHFVTRFEPNFRRALAGNLLSCDCIFSFTMQTAAKPQAGARTTLLLRILLAIPIMYLALLLDQPAGLDVTNITA